MRSKPKADLIGKGEGMVIKINPQWLSKNNKAFTEVYERITSFQKTIANIPEIEALMVQAINNLRNKPKEFEEKFNSLKSFLEKNGFVLPPSYKILLTG
jgi:hypothetical protein